MHAAPSGDFDFVHMPGSRLERDWQHGNESPGGDGWMTALSLGRFRSPRERITSGQTMAEEISLTIAIPRTLGTVEEVLEDGRRR